jgi:hypothetical protein
LVSPLELLSVTPCECSQGSVLRACGPEPDPFLIAASNITVQTITNTKKAKKIMGILVF